MISSEWDAHIIRWADQPVRGHAKFGEGPKGFSVRCECGFTATAALQKGYAVEAVLEHRLYEERIARSGFGPLKHVCR